jgi:hypothetical protein
VAKRNANPNDSVRPELFPRPALPDFARPSRVPAAPRPDERVSWPCARCGRNLDMYGRCRRRTCPGYVKTWLRHQKRRVTENMGAFGQGSTVAQSTMYTITAPGKWGVRNAAGETTYRLPFVPARCKRVGPHTCSGEIGCRVDPVAAEKWNETAFARRRQLHRAAYARTVRKHGTGVCRALVVVPEMQARGVLHFHGIIGAESAAEMAAGITYLEALRDLAGDYGFGQVHLGNGWHGGSHAAGYASKAVKYIGKGSAAGTWLEKAVVAGEIPSRAIDVAPHLVKRTGVTMRLLRLAGYVHAAHGIESPLEALNIARVLATFKGSWLLTTGPPAS